MTTYTTHQTLNDIRWWTGMPLTLKVGGQIVQVRARGTVALTVTAADKLSAQIPNPDDLSSTLTPHLNLAAIDAVGELSHSAANLAQLTTLTPASRDIFKANMASKLAEFGVQVDHVTIEAIESV